jgi:hypothetical protein
MCLSADRRLKAYVDNSSKLICFGFGPLVVVILSRHVFTILSTYFFAWDAVFVAV